MDAGHRRNDGMRRHVDAGHRRNDGMRRYVDAGHHGWAWMGLLGNFHARMAHFRRWSGNGGFGNRRGREGRLDDGERGWGVIRAVLHRRIAIGNRDSCGRVSRVNLMVAPLCAWHFDLLRIFVLGHVGHDDADEQRCNSEWITHLGAVKFDRGRRL
jgi:hypothetical protein